MWFWVGILVLFKVECYVVVVCLLCKYGCIDEEMNEYVYDYVVSVECGMCVCKVGVGGDFGGCIYVIVAFWYFVKL